MRAVLAVMLDTAIAEGVGAVVSSTMPSEIAADQFPTVYFYSTHTVFAPSPPGRVHARVVA
jgi:hypothetical protein